MIGVKIVNCELAGEKNVQIRVGGGYQTLKAYIDINARAAQRNIASSMMKNNQNLHWVLEQLVQGQKHKLRNKKTNLEHMFL